MEPFETSVVAGCVLGGGAAFYGAWSVAAWRRRRSLARAARRGGAAVAAAPAADDPLSWRIERRMEAIEAAQAGLAERLEAFAAEGGEVRLQAVAGSLVGLIKDKNATLEVALAGLDQLRARLKALEQMGDLAEARGLFDRLGARLDEVQAAQAAAQAATEARLAALQAGSENPFAEISEQLTRLYAQKDATVETVFARLAPLEARLAELQQGLAARDPQRALDGFALRLEALHGRLAALETPGENPFAEISERLTGLYAQKDAAVETVVARLAPLEARLAEVAARDPQSALDGFGARLEEVRSTLEARIDDLAVPEENPFAEISEQLTRLYAQKDATVETVFARLAPLEARLAELAARDPQSALEGFAARMETVQARLADLETPGENPFAEISEQLTRLYAQKDATVETVFARLAPLEARLAEIAARDPQAALEGFAARMEAVQARLADLETPGENPFAEISEQLTGLYAQKDAAVETVFARLAPLEARLAELAARDPQAALEGFAARMEAVQARLADLETPGENPFAEISERLTGLYAQKDATVETVFARLAPLEARLAELAARDPQAALEGFAARMEGLHARLADLETPGENPFAEISERLTGLYAQKDAAVETVFARLAPLEARLAALEGGLARLGPLAEDDPRAAVEGLRTRVEALHWAQGEVAGGLAALQAAGAEGGALAGVADQLTRLFAQKDASVAALIARLAPLEQRLGELEARPWDPDAEEARAQAQAVAAQLIAARAAAEHTALFADRLALLEASLPRLSATQAQAMQAQAMPETGMPETGMPETGRRASEATAPAAEALETIWTLPRIVSLHHK